MWIYDWSFIFFEKCIISAALSVKFAIIPMLAHNFYFVLFYYVSWFISPVPVCLSTCCHVFLGSEDKTWLSPSTPWVPGMELRSSGMAAGTVTQTTISLALHTIFSQDKLSLCSLGWLWIRELPALFQMLVLQAWDITHDFFRMLLGGPCQYLQINWGFGMVLCHPVAEFEKLL